MGKAEENAALDWENTLLLREDWNAVVALGTPGEQALHFNKG